MLYTLTYKNSLQYSAHTQMLNVFTNILQALVTIVVLFIGNISTSFMRPFAATAILNPIFIIRFATNDAVVISAVAAAVVVRISSHSLPNFPNLVGAIGTNFPSSGFSGAICDMALFWHLFKNAAFMW